MTLNMSHMREEMRLWELASLWLRDCRGTMRETSFRRARRGVSRDVGRLSTPSAAIVQSEVRICQKMRMLHGF